MALSKGEMGSPHPNLGALSAFLDGRLSEADRDVCIDHLSECAECRTVLATFVRGSTPAGLAPTASGGPSARAMFRRAVWLPIAATLALATTAGIMVWRMDPSGRTDGSSPALTVDTSSSNRPATGQPTAGTPTPDLPPGGAAPSPPAPVPPPSRPDANTTTRGGGRVVGSKTFRLVAGEWVDAAYDPFGLLPVEVIDSPASRTAVIARLPSLAPFAALGARVVVVHEGVVYRFSQ